MLEVPSHRPRKHHLFKVAALGYQVFESIAMRDAGDVLLDDRSFIEGLGDVVAGGADEFDASFVGGMIWFRSNKGRQKRVMDIDDAPRVTGDELGRQYFACNGPVRRARYCARP